MIGIALSGGGAKGAFEVGAVQYLFESGRLKAFYQPNQGVLAGVSVGALNAVVLAEGPGGIDRLRQIWTNLEHMHQLWVENFDLAGKRNPTSTEAPIEYDRRFDQPGRSDAHLGVMNGIFDYLSPKPRAMDAWEKEVKAMIPRVPGLLAAGLSSIGGTVLLIRLLATLSGASGFSETSEIHPYLFDTEPLRSMMRNGARLGGVNIPGLNVGAVLNANSVDLILGMVGLGSGRYHIWHKQRYLQAGAQGEQMEGNVVEAAMASLAIPVMFPPVSFRGEDMVDGGVRNVSPAADVYSLADEIYVILDYPVHMPNVDIPNFDRIIDRIVAANLHKDAMKDLFDPFIRGHRYRDFLHQPPEPTRVALQQFFDSTVIPDMQTRAPGMLGTLYRTLDILLHEIELNELMRLITFNDALTLLQGANQPRNDNVFAKVPLRPRRIHVIAPVDNLYDTQDVMPSLIRANIDHGRNVAAHILDGQPLQIALNKYGRNVVAGVAQHNPLAQIREQARAEYLAPTPRTGFPMGGRQFIQVTGDPPSVVPPPFATRPDGTPIPGYRRD